jgi:UDP-glucose 4-epimerase
MHFAAKSLVSESIINPNLYYRNNVIGTLNLVNEMLKNNINNLVFSSTAAIYGNPITDTIAESHPKNPINPYGRSKLITENILEDICISNDFNAICLRYFNAAGAHESGEIGESRDPETHLIPNILNAALNSQSDLKIYGDNYPTEDGTCIRDYVHVMDLAQAHLLGMNYIQNNNGFSAFNLGNGNGFSVKQIIKSCERIINSSITYEIDLRREGDPASLIADSNLAQELLGWKAYFNNIDSIVSSALKWHNSCIDRY